MNFIQKYIGPLISKVIMISQNQPLMNKSILNAAKLKVKKNKHMTMMIGNIESTGGAKLNFCEIYSKPAHSVENEKVIIYAEGREFAYETNLDKYIQQAKKNPETRIVGFNFRNVQLSKGVAYTQEDWIDDVLAIVNYYTKKGIFLRNIVLNGHSLGGAICTLAAARIYEQNTKKGIKEQERHINLFNNRSFSTLTQQILWTMLGGIGSGIISALLIALPCAFFWGSIPALYLGGAISSLGLLYPKAPMLLLQPLLDGILSITFGRLDALSAFNKLPTHAKGYIMAKDDAVISPKSSLHYGLKPVNHQRKQMIRHDIKEAQCQLKNCKTHNARKKFMNKLEKLKEELIDIKDAKVCLNNKGTLSNDAHFEPLSKLMTYHRCRSQNNTASLPKQISAEEIMERRYKRFF